MKILISEKISEHKYKTPEGYLVCVDSILARTGKQAYQRNEIFGDGDDTIVEVDRPSSEVFSERTLASFENKPICIGHPKEDVTVDNYKDLAVGEVRDIKKGVVDGQEVMLGTLILKDPEAIAAVESGEMTDISCGYDADIKDEPNPVQRNIRGNHVALCEEGRAGVAHVVDSAIKDKAPNWFVSLMVEAKRKFGTHDIKSVINYLKSNSNLDEDVMREYYMSEYSFLNMPPWEKEAWTDSVKDEKEYIFIFHFTGVSETVIAENEAKAVEKLKSKRPDLDLSEVTVQRSRTIENESDRLSAMNIDSLSIYDDEIASNSRELFNVINKWLAGKPGTGKETVKINGKILSGTFTLFINGGDVLVNYQPLTGGIVQKTIKVNRQTNSVSQSDVNEVIRDLYAHAQEVARRSAVKNIKFLYMECEYSENGKLYRELKGKKFTASNLNELNKILFKYDDETRENKEGYWKTYFDGYWQLDGHKYKQRFDRIDVGDGHEYVKVTPQDIENRTKMFKQYYMENNSLAGITRADSVSDAATPVKIIEQKKSDIGNTYYLVEGTTGSGIVAWFVTKDASLSSGYDVEFNYHRAKETFDAWLKMDELERKYGKNEGYKKWMAKGMKADAVKDSYFRVTEKQGTLFSAYFIKANSQSAAKEIAENEAKRTGATVAGVVPASESDVEEGKRRGMSVLGDSVKAKKIVSMIKAIDSQKAKDSREFVYYLFKSKTELGTVQKVTGQYSAEGDGFYTSALPGKKFNTAEEALNFSIKKGWKQITRQEYDKLDGKK